MLDRAMAATTAHDSAKVLVRHAVTRGIPAATAASWLGVLPDELERPGRLPLARVLAAWLTLRDELADNAVAARAMTRWTLADHGLFGFYLGSAPTLRDALAAAVRSSRLLTDRGGMSLVEDGALARLCWTWNGAETPDHTLSNEVIVSGVALAIRELGGAPLRVCFTHRAPGKSSEHAALLHCDVRFAQPHTAVELERARLDAVPRGANRALHDFLGGLAHRALDELGAPALRDRAVGLVARRLRDGGELPTLPEIARNLGMSERTLRRKLAEHQLSFRALRCEAQLAHAEALLVDGGASLSEIALACGFADASAFGRAWRRSRGTAPSRSHPRRRG